MADSSIQQNTEPPLVRVRVKRKKETLRKDKRRRIDVSDQSCEIDSKQIKTVQVNETVKKEKKWRKKFFEKYRFGNAYSVNRENTLPTSRSPSPSPN